MRISDWSSDVCSSDLLRVWHGFNLPLAMSFLALIGGILLLWLLRHRHRSRPGKAPLIYRLDGRRTFDLVLEGLDAVADFMLAWTRPSRLQPQLLLIVLCTFFVAILPPPHGRAAFGERG